MENLNKNKLSIVNLVLIIILGVCLVTFFVIQVCYDSKIGKETYFNEQRIEELEMQNIDEQVLKVDSKKYDKKVGSVVEMNTFVDEEFGFTFDYPSTWGTAEKTFSDYINNEDLRTFISPNCKADIVKSYYIGFSNDQIPVRIGTVTNIDCFEGRASLTDMEVNFSVNDAVDYTKFSIADSSITAYSKEYDIFGKNLVVNLDYQFDDFTALTFVTNLPEDGYEGDLYKGNEMELYTIVKSFKLTK